MCGVVTVCFLIFNSPLLNITYHSLEDIWKQYFPQHFVRLWWVDFSPLEENLAHFKVRCINLLHFEGNI